MTKSFAIVFFSFAVLDLNLGPAPTLLVHAQEDETAVPPSSTPRLVNLFVINDEQNEIANKSVMNSLNELKKQSLLGEALIVQINGSDAKGTLDKVCEIWDAALQKGNGKVPDLVLDTTINGPGAETINSFTSALGLPTLSAQFGQEGDLRQWRDLDEDKRKYLIQVMPPADLVPEAIRQLAISMNVSNAAILFDDAFVMDHKYKSLLQNVPTRHVIVRIKEAGLKLQEQLSTLRNLDIVNFFTLGGQESLAAVLNAGQALNFTGRKYAWIALTLDDFGPKCNCINVTVLFMKPKPSQNQQILGELTNNGLLSQPLLSSAFYYDLPRLGVMAMKSAMDAGQWPTNAEQISCDSYDQKNTPTRSFNLLQILADVSKSREFQPSYAGFRWGMKNGEHHASFEMAMNMVTITNSNPVSTDEVGSWDAGIDNNLQVTSQDMIENHTAVTSYRVVAVPQAPFVMYDKETKEWSGYSIDLLDDIKDELGFEYEIREPDDGLFGNLNENGSWNGMIKELKDKRADVAIGSLSVMAERESVIDFTVPFYDLVGISILMKKAVTPASIFKFLSVLESDVWYCILASYFFTSFLMWVFDRWSPYSFQNNQEKYKDDDEKRVFTLKESLWFCMTSLTPQGGGEAPKCLSGKLIAATWWMFGFIIIASYTANLAAFLTVSRLESPVDSLDDLSKQYKIQYAPLEGSSTHTYFMRMADIETRFYEIWKDMSLNDSISDVERAKLAVWEYPVSDKYTKMYQAMTESKFPKTIEDALERVMASRTASEGFAFIGDATDIRYLTLTSCDYIIVGEEFSRKPYAMAVQQGSPLKDQFNAAILTLLNNRKLEKLKEKWWNQNPLKKVCEKLDNQNDGISMENIGGVFVVIAIGIIMACITLAFEYYWYRYRPKVNNMNQNPIQKNMTSTGVKPMRFNLRPAPGSIHEPGLNSGARF